MPLEKSKRHYQRVKREVFADPRIYENDPQYPKTRLAEMYDIHIETLRRWIREAKTIKRPR